MVKRLTSDDRNDKSRGFAPAERNVEGEPVGPSFEGVLGEGTLSRRRMLGLAGGALTGLLLTPLTLSGGEASAEPLGTWEIRQKSSGRYLDAYEISSKDYRVVTRDDQDNDTQRWLLERFRYPTGTSYYYRIRQKSSGRYLDAYELMFDTPVMTRTHEDNKTQKWLLGRHDSATGSDYEIRQWSSDRYLDAYEISSKDYAVVTRDDQDNNTQRWLLKKV